MLKLQGYVYRYTDILTDEIVYVGIVYPGHSLRARLQKEWRSFPWLKDSIYKVEYQVHTNISQTDLQTLEAHLICSYRTRYNIQKRNWGESAYVTVNDAKWEEYEYHSILEIEQLREELARLRQENEHLRQELKKEAV